MKHSPKRFKYNNILLSIERGFSNNSLVKKNQTKFPRVFQFFINRLSLNRFNGLPLTFLFTSFCANFLLFNEIVETFENSKSMFSIDKFFGYYLFSIRIVEVANFLFCFSKLGNMPIVIIIASISTYVFLSKRKTIYIISLLTTLIGSGITIFLGKNYFHRVRPADFSFYQESSYSFPSGHAIIAIAFYGLLFYVIIRETKRYKTKLLWVVFSFFFYIVSWFQQIILRCTLSK